jgi:hypothetical protein
MLVETFRNLGDAKSIVQVILYIDFCCKGRLFGEVNAPLGKAQELQGIYVADDEFRPASCARLDCWQGD